jgi:hypothetical protein
MKQTVLYSALVLTLAVFAACGESNGDMETHSHGEDAAVSMQQSDSMKSLEEWIRSEPVDVNAVDTNGDGYVYQDPMDWNVIADEEGKCPKCNMFLVKVTIDEAVKNLQDNGYTVK